MIPTNPKSIRGLERIRKIHDLAGDYKENPLQFIVHTFLAFIPIPLFSGVLLFPMQTLTQNVGTFFSLSVLGSLLCAAMALFILNPEVPDLIQSSCYRRKIEALRKITLEVKTALQDSPNLEHRMVALVMNVERPYEYADGETYRRLLRWRNGDNSPDVMKSVDYYVSKILNNISYENEMKGDSDVLRRMSSLQTRCRTIESSPLIPALEKLPVLLAFSALTYMTQKGMEDPEFRNGVETLESRIEGILEIIRTERQLLEVRREEERLLEKRKILKLALEDVR